MSYVVICTYGNTIYNAPFAAGIKSLDDAERLKEIAISLGYRDAEVIGGTEFKEIRAAVQRRWAAKRGPEAASRAV